MNGQAFAFRTLLRRRLILVGLVFGVASDVHLRQASGSAREGRPNVLFIICDDLNDSIEGMGGHPQARTPNIDRLTRSGVRFTNAQCVVPLCGPSRASLLTGLHPSTTGYYGYRQGENRWRDNPVLKDACTIIQHFRDNGYNVYGTGKIFHNGQEDWDVWKTNGEFGVRPDFGPWPWDGRTDRPGQVGSFQFMSPHPGMPEPLRSSVRWRSFGPLSNVPEYKADPDKGIPGYKGWVTGGRPFRYVSETDRDRMPDELNADWAADVLKRSHDKPFFLAVGFNRPHTPLYAPKKYFDMFPLADIQLPPYQENDLEDCARILWQLVDEPSRYVGLPDRYGFETFELLHRAGGQTMWKRWIQAYLACVALVDEQVGRIIDALEQSPYANNTIVVFTSDHGYQMGEKNYIFKHSAWEESARVPLIVVAPGSGKADVPCDHPVSHLDLYPTLVDLCRLPADPNTGGNNRPLDGHSMRPFIENPATDNWDGPPVAITALTGPDVLEVNQPGRPERQHHSVRSKDWRYILCCNGEEELYDHRNDPHEWTNLAGDPRHAQTKQQLHGQLLLLSGRRR